MSAEYVRGRRKPYLHPLQLFFVANLIYFLLQPLTQWTGLKTPLYTHTTTMSYSRLASHLVAQRIAAKGVSLAEFTRSFDHVIDLHARSLVVLMVPLLALAVWALEFRKQRLLGEHLVFALHFYALWLIGLLIVWYGGATAVILALKHFGIRVNYGRADVYIYLPAAFLLAVYLFAALRVFYGDKVLAAAVKALILVEATRLIMQTYRFILFLTSLYST